MPQRVGQAAAQGEEGSEGKQIGVDHPLHPGGERPSSLWICGTAMETIVWSMKVIATAKIIAAKITYLDWPPPPPAMSTPEISLHTFRVSPRP